MSQSSYFEAARERLRTCNLPLTDASRNKLYALFKQATEGDCPDPPPSNASSRVKWEAWARVRGMNPQLAMDNYVAEVQVLDRSWDPRAPAAASSPAPRTERKEGVLYKQRDVFKGWRPRHFVLDEATLHYFLMDENPNLVPPRKSLMLSGCTITEVKVTRVGDTEYFPFVISHPQSSKTYNLASDREQDAQEWIRALREAAASAPPSLVSGSVDPTSRLVARRVNVSDAPTYDAVDSSGKAAVPADLAPKINSCVSALLEAASSEDDWQHTGVKNGVTTYRRPSAGAAICVRGDSELPFPMAQVFALIIDLSRQKEYDALFHEGRRAKKFSNRTWVDHVKFKQIWPTSARDLVNVCHWRMLDDGTLVISAFSHKFPDIPLEEGTVRAELILGGYIFKPVNGGRGVKATYIVQTDLKGSIPSTVANIVASSQPQLLYTMRKVLEDTSHLSSHRFIIPQRKTATAADLDIEVENVDNPAPRTPTAEHEETKAGSAPVPPTSAAASPKAETEPKAAPRAPIPSTEPIGFVNLCVLFLPVILYGLVPTHLRGAAFLAGCIFALRYVFRLHLGAPRQTVRSTDSNHITEGRMLVKFPVDISKLLRYLEDKRKSTEIEITLTHVAVKATAIALTEHQQLNGRVILGGFYPSNEIEVSVTVNLPKDDAVVVKISHANKKPVDYIADELTKKVTQLRSGQDPVQKRKAAILNALPPIVAQGVETAINFLGGQLGLTITFLGVQRFPLGSAVIVTAPATDGNDADVDMSVIPTMYNASTPITITVGGIRAQPKVDGDKKINVTYMLGITATIDCRACSLQQGRGLCERIQQLLNNPTLIEKFDRQQVLALEKEAKSSS